MEVDYTFIKQIKIFNSDPICAIDLNSELLLFGTMLGYCGYLIIKTKELFTVSEIEDEHIIAAQIKSNKLCFAVGDEKLIILEKINPKYNNYITKEIKNYGDEAAHYKKCDNIFCMLSGDYLFSIELKIPKEEEKAVDERYSEWKIRNTEKKSSFKGKIIISNYWVPFDFDGYNLIYIDFLQEHKRRLKIFNFVERKFILELNLWEMENEFFGHISHIRKLNNNKIFLVHSYKLCEIRSMDFKLLKNFEHKGSEIIACDFYYNSKNQIEIVLLDIDGSVYVYNESDNYELYKFNLNKFNFIKKKIKDQKFFSLGYPYYIKKHNKLYAITTDQGCFLIKNI